MDRLGTNSEIENEIALLSDKRQRWVDANEENQFGEGIRNLLTELYPENAHFIYELLQNAEDARATNVMFTLSEDKLTFEHDGRRHFSLADMESITSIGASTKRNDPTSIGKFGVGFKAVFAYTESPEVHSETIRFRIRDLVVPDTNGLAYTGLAGKTVFVFPFDHPRKKPESAVHEIKRGLCELPSSTLLFLTNIQSLRFILPDGRNGHIERSELNETILRIDSSLPESPNPVKDRLINLRPNTLQEREPTNPNSETLVKKNKVEQTHWLRFDKDCMIVDPESSGQSKQCRVSLAFQLEQSNKDATMNENLGGMAETPSWKIVPTKVGEVCIYFPAVKETSKLHFHMHAPFASTVARDSVRDCEVNEELRDALADLLAESMHHIRNKGLLSVSFLSVLPIPSDDLSDFYEPIRVRILSEFQQRALTPTKSGKHKKSTILRKGPRELTSRLDDEDLAVLADFEFLRWAAQPNQQNSREDKFLSSLGIDEWSYKELRESAEGIEDSLAYEWLLSKPDDWFVQVYSRLSKLNKHHEALDAVEKFPIVRTDANTQAFPKRQRIYLSAAGKYLGQLTVVKKSIVSNDDAKQYLQSIGIRDFDLASQVELLVAPKYRSNSHQISFEENVSDLLMMAKVFDDDETGDRFKTLIKNSACVICENAATGLSMHKRADECYLKSPGIKCYFEGNQNAWFISEKYEEMPVETYSRIRKFFFAIGVGNAKPREIGREAYRYDGHGWHVRGLNGFNPTWTFDGLEFALENPTLERSVFLWNVLLRGASSRICGRVQQSSRQGFPASSTSEEVKTSAAGTMLQEHAWIPTNCGKFVAPRELGGLDKLHDSLTRDDELLAILDGGSSLKTTEAASALGISTEQFLLVQKMTPFLLKHPQEFVTLVLQMQSRDKNQIQILGTDEGNRERRSKKLRERLSEAPTKSSELRVRSVALSYRSEVDREALFTFYRDEEESLFCQICFDSMPFVRSNGKEAASCVSLFSRKWSDSSGYALKTITPLNLVLCPVCAELYIHYVHDNVELQQSLFEQLQNGAIAEFEICDRSVRLDGRDTSLKFNRKHLADIRDCVQGGDEIQ